MPKAEDRPIRIRWDVDESLSERAQAVQIGLALMLATRTTSMRELTALLREGGPQAERLRKGLNLWHGDPADTPAQRLHISRLELLDRFGTTLSGIGRPSGKSHRFSTGIMECVECGRWGYVASDTAPRSCPWTRGCDGGVLKVPASGTDIEVL